MKPPLYPKPQPKSMILGIINKQEKLKALLDEKKRKIQLLDKVMSELDIIEGRIRQVTGSINGTISSYRKSKK
jgi:16S rRNA G527 N7-methylase RsmG